MPIIGSQNPWVTGAGIAGDQGNQLAQTLLRIPFLKQQQQQGALQNQLLQGQVNFQPQQQQGQLGLVNARIGAENALGGANKARGELYQAQTSLTHAKDDTVGSQNTALKDLQATVQDIMLSTPPGQAPSPELQAKFSEKLIGLDPKSMSKIADSLLQARGLMNPTLMGDPRMQAASMLGNKTAANGVTLNANAVNYPPGGGTPLQGDVRTSPGQQIASPTGVPLADNMNKNGAQSSGLAIAALRAAVADPNNVNPQQVIQAAQAYQQALAGGGGQQQQQQQPQTNQAPQLQPPTQPSQQPAQTNRAFIWTPQGLVPK